MNFTLVFIAAAALLAVVAVMIVLKLKLPGPPGGEVVLGHYALRASLLSPAERSFAGVLDGALPEGFTWMAKVRLGDIVVTKRGLTRSQATSARNRVNQKHVDFLLVRVSDFAPVVAIELDDKSHAEEDRKARDTFVDAVAESAGLPLLHVPAQAAYNQAELRAKIASALGKSTAAAARET